jgi:hypothetical protein
MLKLFILAGITIWIMIVIIVWCCLKVGAQADKDIEKLERPDLINFKK